MYETSTVTPARHDARPSARPPGWGAALLRCGSPWCRARPGWQGPPPCAEARGAGSPRRRRRGTMPARGRSDLRRRSSWRATATSTGVDMPAPRPGGGGPPRRTRPGRVPETWVPRGRGRREGPERRQAPAVPVPRTPPRRGHRGHVRIPPHACGRSGGVPARDALARGPGRAPPGQAGGRGRLPPAGPPGRSPCWPTRGATRPRAGTGGARRTGRSHAGRRGTRSASPSAATGGAGRTPRASARGNQASPGRGRRMRATSRGAPTRHATWRGATRRSSGSPGRRRRPTTRGGQGHSRTRRTHHAGPASHAACRGCSRARIPDSTGRGRGGCLDLFHVMMSPPDERMGKAACVLDRAMRFPHALRYRECYRKKTSSKGTRSSWEPTASKGGLFKNFSGQLGVLRNYGGGLLVCAAQRCRMRS